MFFSAGIGRTGTFIVIDILIDVIREKGESAWPRLLASFQVSYIHKINKIQMRFNTLSFIHAVYVFPLLKSDYSLSWFVLGFTQFSLLNIK